MSKMKENDKKIPPSIWDIAVDLEKRKYVPKHLEVTPEKKDADTGEEAELLHTIDELFYKIPKGNESVVLFLGSKSSGKTSMILRVLEREEAPKPTISLEYTFGRRARGQTLAKDIGHIWELGSATSMVELVRVAITAQNLSQTSVVVVVDLSKLDELWVMLELLLNQVRSEIDSVATQLSENNKQRLTERLEEQQNINEHPDKALLSPFPIPLVIIGGKYDIFQGFEPEQKKTVCKTLRFMAHLHGASLMFYSQKNETLTTRTKSLLSNLIFDTPVNKHLVTDYNKPLSILAGMDTFQQIGIPPSTDTVDASGAKSPLDLWRNAYCSHFPQKKLSSSLNRSDIVDPGSDKQFEEASVDAMRHQKDEELKSFREKKTRLEKYGSE